MTIKPRSKYSEAPTYIAIEYCPYALTEPILIEKFRAMEAATKWTKKKNKARLKLVKAEKFVRELWELPHGFAITTEQIQQIKDKQSKEMTTEQAMLWIIQKLGKLKCQEHENAKEDRLQKNH